MLFSKIDKFGHVEYQIKNVVVHSSFQNLLLWLACVADVDILFSSCGFFFISSPILSRRRLDALPTILQHIMWP